MKPAPHGSRFNNKRTDYRVPITLAMILGSVILMYLIIAHVLDKASRSSVRPPSTFGPTASVEVANRTRHLNVLDGISVKYLSGGTVDLGAAYLGHVVLVVNVASHCGFTETNYRELESMYKRYKKRLFTVLAFPCNQFGEQEADSPKEIEYFARRVKGAHFPLLEKVDVNGPNAAQLFVSLKAALRVARIEWNFGKFLIGRDGVPRRYFPHDFSFAEMDKAIQEELNRVL
jgi:glutathione peroxidase